MQLFQIEANQKSLTLTKKSSRWNKFFYRLSYSDKRPVTYYENGKLYQEAEKFPIELYFGTDCQAAMDVMMKDTDWVLE